MSTTISSIADRARISKFFAYRCLTVKRIKVECWAFDCIKIFTHCVDDVGVKKIVERLEKFFSQLQILVDGLPGRLRQLH